MPSSLTLASMMASSAAVQPRRRALPGGSARSSEIGAEIGAESEAEGEARGEAGVTLRVEALQVYPYASTHSHD